MIPSRTCWLFASLMGLAGCVATTPLAPAPSLTLPNTPPSEVQQVAAPPTGNAPGKLPTLPAALTLDQSIHACLVNDPRLRGAVENVNQAIGDYITASLIPNPTANIDNQLMPLTRPFTVEKTGGPMQFDTGASWRIDWFLFGKRAADMATKSHGIRVAEADYADTVRRRIADVAQAFYSVLEARELLRVARQDVENIERVESVLSKGVAAGGKPQVDLSRVRLDLLTSRRAFREAEAAVTTTRARLRSFLGHKDSDLTFDVEGSLESPLVGDILSADQAFAQAEQNRADVQALRNRMALAEADVENQKRKGCPEVTPNLWYTRQFQGKAVGAPDASSWNVALQVTVPLFDRNQGERVKASAVATQSRLELQSALVDLRAEIETVIQELLTARANAESLTGEQLKLAAEVRDNITRAYQAGGRTLLEALDANKAYNETLRAAISTRANYWRALYRYYSVIGRQVTLQDAPAPVCR